MSGNNEEHDSQLQAIGDDFYESLSDLTLNSRPIISSLTEIAQENVNAAQFITSAVEKRIEKAIPSQKLFAFYLLDSISKNIGSPYTLLFGTHLFQTFTQAFLLVDDQTRNKFIALFKTWKVAKNMSGLPLFPQEPIDKIERFLIKASSIYQQQMQQQQQQQQQQIPPQIRTPQFQSPTQSILQTVDRLVDLTNKRLNFDPQNTMVRSKLDLIHQLKFALQSNSVPEASLPVVAKQVDDMMKQEEAFLRSSVTPQPNSPVPNLSNVLPPVIIKNEPLTNNVNVNPILPSLSNNNNNNNNNNINNINNNNKNPLGLLNNIMDLKKPKSASGSPVPILNSKPDLSSLISTLKKTGLVKSETKKSTIPSNALLKTLLSKSSTQSLSSSLSNLTSTIKSTNLSSTNNEFSKFDLKSKNLFNQDPSESFKDLMITKFPNKCGQCGKRFDNSEKGQNLRRDHLDWHFRMNKKLKDGFVPQSKIWYLDDEQFVNFRDSEIFNKDYGNDDEQNNEELKKNKEDNSKKYVIVPSDSNDMSCVCGVCKETLRGQYDDELGEWIWNNAIESKGKVFHYNCFIEANSKSNTAATTGSTGPTNLMSLVQGKRNRENDDDEGGNKKKATAINGVNINLLQSIVNNVKKEKV